MIKVKSKLKEFVADIFVKVFQIVFAMLVIGVLLKEKFNFTIFGAGLIISLLTLTGAITLYYNALVDEGGAK